jgi:serine/threonine protein kinase
MWQLLQGLDFLHHNWVMHRDLKPSNVSVIGAISHDWPGFPPLYYCSFYCCYNSGLDLIFQVSVLLLPSSALWPTAR